jgi:hypothetical protein
LILLAYIFVHVPSLRTHLQEQQDALYRRYPDYHGELMRWFQEERLAAGNGPSTEQGRASLQP